MTGKPRVKDIEAKLISELMKNSRRSDRELAKNDRCLPANDQQDSKKA